MGDLNASARVPGEPVPRHLRRFNRVYTQRLGLLNARLDGSAFSLTEARILYELAHRQSPTAAEIARALDVHRGQLRRTPKRFEQAGLLTGEVSGAHARHRLLFLTPAAGIRSTSWTGRPEAIATLLEALPARRRRRLIEAMASIVEALGSPERDPANIFLRDLKPGDLGLVTSRHAILYAEEYGWDLTYEALVAEILASFVRTFDPALERAWIAEVGGAMAGSIFLMRSPTPGLAKLRLLYVEPEMRGLDIGGRLVGACIERARAGAHHLAPPPHSAYRPQTPTNPDGPIVARHRIYTTRFSSVYPHYVAKAEKKGRTKAEVDAIIAWLTGYGPEALAAELVAGTDFETFFARAPRMNPAREAITGTVCGVRVETIEEPLMREIRYLDKLVDELARGKKMEVILRAG